MCMSTDLQFHTSRLIAVRAPVRLLFQVIEYCNCHHRAESELVASEETMVSGQDGRMRRYVRLVRRGYVERTARRLVCQFVTGADVLAIPARADLGRELRSCRRRDHLQPDTCRELP